MIKILIYKGKYGRQYYDISTEPQEDAVFLELFNMFNDLGYYGWTEPVTDERTNPKSAKRLLTARCRKEYEYETFEIIEPMDLTKGK